MTPDVSKDLQWAIHAYDVQLRRMTVAAETFHVRWIMDDQIQNVELPIRTANVDLILALDTARRQLNRGWTVE